MGRSAPTEISNPAQRFFEFAAKQGEVRYWDKTLGENGENVTVPLPFQFIILERGFQITGGRKIGTSRQKKEYLGYFSNFVRDLKTETFVVRSKNGSEGEGVYADIKTQVNGAKLQLGLYIAFKDENKQLQIGYLKLKGSALSEWFDFAKNKNIWAGAFAIAGRELVEPDDEDQKPYYVPVFKQVLEIPADVEVQATAFDRDILTPYFKAYFSRKPVTEEVDTVDAEQPDLPNDEDEAVSPPKAQAVAASSEVAPNSDDDDIDIPW
jgi:hypothetical protein